MITPEFVRTCRNAFKEKQAHDRQVHLHAEEAFARIMYQLEENVKNNRFGVDVRVTAGGILSHPEIPAYSAIAHKKVIEWLANARWMIVNGNRTIEDFNEDGEDFIYTVTASEE